MTMKADPGRRAVFECLVLQGMWVLILCAFGAQPRKQAANFASGALAYCDEHGPGDPQYRRDVSFAILP